MTNKIMQNNSLYNINNNKILQDKLSTMMSTQKKLTRPSDDPIVAIRALRLRTSVSEIAQYREKNAEDAKAWLTVTEDALETVTEILGGDKGITGLVQRSANKDLTPTDININMQQILSLRDEFYSTANVDYAGRYIFTGYRTNTTLSFTKEVEQRDLSYDITEQFTLAGFDLVNYTDLKDLANLTKSNYDSYPDITEQDIINQDIHRLRLSYDDVATGAGNEPVISYVDTSTDPPTVVDIIGGTSVPFIPITEISSNRVYPTLDPYQQIAAWNEDGTEGAVYIPETGEILLSNAAFAAIRSNPAIVADTELRVSYTKDNWKEGDLRPEHYFACTSTEVINPSAVPPETETISYNMGKLDGTYRQQTIEYDVGYNQKIQVNTLAEDVFRHALDRNVDDLDRAVQTLLDIEATMNGLYSILDENSPEYELIQKQYDAARKAYDYTRDMVHGLFEKAITTMQDALNKINVAVTDSGTRSARLDLISNRLLSQKTTIEVLRSENEDADIAEVAIKLNSAELSYNAALMATGKIMQTSLLNYI
ncbi:MAG: hypothetical protein LBI54_08040 [Lachnospiraceae bacterium]|nr:hypothetical protein [Lachnospiraceae bacterium]